MAQHTDPGAIPIGARPLPIAAQQGEEEEEGDETFLVSNALLSSSSSASLSLSALSPVSNQDGQQQQQQHLALDNIVANNSSSGQGSSNNKKKKKYSRGKKIERRRGVRRCRKCGNNYKPPRAHHDSVTGRCISKFDHFCPWVGNAVGALNHKFFVLFIFYTFLASLISLLLLLMRYIRCGFTVDDSDNFEFDGTFGNSSIVSGISSSSGHAGKDNRHLSFLNDHHYHDRGLLLESNNRNMETHSTFLFEGCEEIYSLKILVLLVMSICFLVFTCCMLFEQIDAIESNTSKIARMKLKMGQDTNGEYEKVAKGFNEMFGIGIGGQGSNVALHWFLPTPVRFPDDVERDRVLGYEYFSIWEGKIYQEDEEEEGHNQGKEMQARALRTKNTPEKQLNRGRKSALMLSDSDHEGEIALEIELPEGIGLNLEGRSTRNGSRTISRRSSGRSKFDNDSSEHSVAHIV